MLKLRILTAALLIPPLLAGMFLLPSGWVAALLGLFIVAGAWEWAGLMGMQGNAERFIYTVSLMATGAVLIIVDHRVATWVFAIATAAWAVALWALARWPVHDRWFLARATRGAIGFLILVPCWVAAYTLHAQDPHRPYVLLFALVLVWVADSMAYFTGRFFGRRKLAASISPGKTVEGVIGGAASVALLAAFGGTLVWQYGDARLAAWIALATATALFSVVGDLLESKFKRIAGVKDSGQLLPGHGGALDRIDALTAALPVFALGWLLWFHP